MNPFAYARAASHADAVALLKDSRFRLPVLKGGGMDVVDHLKEGLIEPDAVIDVRRVRGPGEPIAMSGAVLRIDSSVTLAALAESPLLLDRCPVVPQAVGSAATPQVRNVATAAGNLLQRPRCWYYRAEQFKCLKKGGSTCFAADGENKYHAIFGGGPCHIVHPSNLAPALMVTDATVHLTGGARDEIAIRDLYHMPEKGVRSEHNLEPAELVTQITFNPAPVSGFYAIKEKHSFDWPLVAACVALEMNGDIIRSARVCAAAVAPVPRMLPAVQRALVGLNVDDQTLVKKACARSVDGAEPLAQNAYKLRLLPVAVYRAILKATGRPIEGLPRET